MNVLEKILEEIERLQNISGWDLQTIQGVLEIIRSHMNDGKDTDVPTNNGWIPVEDRLPEISDDVLVQWEKYDRHADIIYTYMDKMWLDSIDENGNPIFETIGGIPNGKIIAWQPLPEPYKPKEEPKQAKNTQQEME